MPAPALLYQDLNLAQRVLRDMATEETARVVVDSRETFVRMQEFAREYTPALADRINHYAGERPLFDLHGVEDEIEKALARRVDLKSGGYLIIDQTEAMTTIDVNTGGFVGGRSFDDTIFKTNLEAAQVIARQLRLRNLGGIIIIDFIDMENADHRTAVLAELETRAREGPHAAHGQRLHAARPGRDDAQAHARIARARAVRDRARPASGRGEFKTAQTICYEILREILREAKQFNAREFRILASQSVIDLFLDEESQSLAQLGDFIGKPISLQVESIYTQEQYDIVLIYDEICRARTNFVCAAKARTPSLFARSSQRGARSRRSPKLACHMAGARMTRGDNFCNVLQILWRGHGAGSGAVPPRSAPGRFESGRRHRGADS